MELLKAVRTTTGLLADERAAVAQTERQLREQQKALGEGLALEGLLVLGDWVLVKRSECSKEQLEQAGSLAGAP